MTSYLIFHGQVWGFGVILWYVNLSKPFYSSSNAHKHVRGTLKRENASICDMVARCERKPTPNVKVDTICATFILCKKIESPNIDTKFKKMILYVKILFDAIC